ncbi:MAG TPA: Sip1-related alpha-galactosidase [Pyrinomonadaceae bacterium]|nr:Sip1-related alpha-galactosidase [Pyrinomonadaceae bacterium]
MTTKRLFILFFFCLLAFGNNPNLNAAPPQPEKINFVAQSTNPARSSNDAQSGMPLGVAVERGALQLKAGAGAVVSNLRIRLRHGDGSTSTLYDLELAGQDAGDDKAGRFERLRYRLKPAAAAPGAPPVAAPTLQATLELRRYLSPEVLVASLDYDGPALAARDGVQLVMGLDNFARGMAHKRFKLYWTAPAFISDHRLLSPANVLLLWQQTAGDAYHLMIPLAGGGMVSEVGVSEIEYRPEFRVSASSHDPRHAPRRVPLFAYATSRDPYQLPRDAYQTAFASTEQYGQLRWQKTLPEPFGWLGWCSWNAYQQTVDEGKILASARSLRDKQIRVGFMLIDDGWLTVKGQKLAGFDADPAKFPRGLGATARALREQYRIPHLGVWHTFQGYWTGVDLDSPLARDYQLFRGREGNALPDPREGRGAKFYADWYARLKEWGFDFVKVDGQANNVKFTDGLMPLFASASGSQRNLQEAAQQHFSYRSDGERRADGVGVINCMEMTLENAYNWRTSNVARNSDDYLPEVAHNFKDHIFQNAYNAYWMANFAYPDWDMFQSHDANGEYHAVARAVSGGPIYFTDEPGKERAELLRPLAFSDGRLLMLDEPGQVTRDLLFTDVSLQPAALKIFGRITRPGLSAGMVGAFNANKTARLAWGALTPGDVEGLTAGAAGVAVYRRSDGAVSVLRGGNPVSSLTLAPNGFDLFTLSPVEQGVAVFGLLDKYLGPAAVVSQSLQGRQVEVRLREAGDFGAWLERAPARVELDGKLLPAAAYSYSRGLLRVPRASFGARGGEVRLRIQLAAQR